MLASNRLILSKSFVRVGANADAREILHLCTPTRHRLRLLYVCTKRLVFVSHRISFAGRERKKRQTQPTQHHMSSLLTIHFSYFSVSVCRAIVSSGRASLVKKKARERKHSKVPRRYARPPASPDTKHRRAPFAHVFCRKT